MESPEIKPTPRDLAEKAAEEELGMVSMQSLAQGQADIAKEMHGDRILGAVVISVVVLAMVAFGVFILVEHNATHKANGAANTAQGAADKANDAVAQVQTERNEAATATCIRFNIGQRNTREAIVQGITQAFQPLVAAGDQHKLDDFSAALRASVTTLLPYRDCSPAGIDAFAKNPPPDPATTGG